MASSLAAQDQLAGALAQNAQQQEDLKAQIERSRAESNQVQAQIKAGETQITATRKRIDDERVAITELARVEYQQPDSTLVRLLQSGNAKDWLVGAADLAAAARRGQELRSSLEQDLARLDQEQSARQSDLRRLTALQAQQVTDLGTMEMLGQKQADAGQQLVAEIAATRVELRKVDQQQPALADRISQALDAELSRITGLFNQQAWRQVDLTLQSNPVLQTSLSVGHSTRSRFIWPMPKGPVTQGFGPSQLVFEPPFNGFAHFHTGIDIAGPQHEPVLAAEDGQVVVAATGTSGYGKYVVLTHGQGVTTLYGHLDQILVKPGDRVSQGSAIGLEGSTGNSTGPHLHFEVRVNGTPVDPVTYLPSGPPSPSRA
jgi:murein DD-endopeptidase MepM/ murein hydrolase activator NlpD